MHKLNRIIDVNLNRSREALRVCEDITRFILEDKNLTNALKTIRHKISRISDRLFKGAVKSRNTQKDLGKKSSFDKGRPKNLESLFYNNIHRAQESVRALEEFSKLYNPLLSKDFKAFRFRIYAIEKKIYDTNRFSKAK